MAYVGADHGIAVASIHLNRLGVLPQARRCYAAAVARFALLAARRDAS